jgi:hypothetical protein
MQVHLPGIDYGCMDTASAPPASASVSMATSVPRCCRRSGRWSRSRARVTVLTGLLDRSALYGVLAEIETLGLDFIEVRQLTPERESPQPGDNPVTAVQPNFRSNQSLRRGATMHRAASMEVRDRGQMNHAGELLQEGRNVHD